MSDELDRSRWLGTHEPDIVPLGEPGDVRSGQVAAEWVSRWCENNEVVLPDNAKYLGLAAGQAYPELEFARLLRIKNANVTLVDNLFQAHSRLRFGKDFPGVKAMDMGIFAFLQDPPYKDYSLVTALGVEYALRDSYAIEKFVSLLPNVMKLGGIVTVFPYTGEDPSLFWAQSGFEPLYDQYTAYSGYASNLMYRYVEENSSKD